MLRLPVLSRSSTRSGGFTLVEVMFAVITLGIGLIMIAAVFPVAISQRKLTADETTAASVALTGFNNMKAVGETTGYLPLTATATTDTGGIVAILPAATWTAVCGNLIVPSDNRYAWVPMYRRGYNATGTAAAGVAQIFIVAVAARNTSTFVPADTATPTSNLGPRAVNVTITDGVSGAADKIVFNSGATNAVVQGTYVILADGNTATAGHIFRVGSFVSGTTWELAPGNDYNDGLGPITGNAFIVGKGFTSPTDPTLEGPSMDVAAYTGYVAAK